MYIRARTHYVRLRRAFAKRAQPVTPPRDGRPPLFGARRAPGLAVHIRVHQVLPGTPVRRRRRAERVPSRQRHPPRATARGVRRVRRVSERPAAVRLTASTSSVTTTRTITRTVTSRQCPDRHPVIILYCRPYLQRRTEAGAHSSTP